MLNSVMDRATVQSDALSEFKNMEFEGARARTRVCVCVCVCVLLEFSECKHNPHPVKFSLCNSVEDILLIS